MWRRQEKKGGNLLLMGTPPEWGFNGWVGVRQEGHNEKGMPNRGNSMRPKATLRDGSTQFSSVAQSCPTLCDPMNRSMPGLPVHHQLPESTQTHVHRVGDAIQSSHPLSSPFSSCLQSFPASGSFPVSQFLTSGCQSIGVSALASVLPMNIQD